MLVRWCISSARCLGRVSDISYEFKNARKQLRTLCTLNNAPCPTVGETIDQWIERFRNEDIPEPVESIEHIVAHVIGTNKTIELSSLRNSKLTSNQREHLESLCECRLSRMPVQYIIGEWDFRNLTLKLLPPVFIPRPETEILVDFALKKIESSENTEKLVLDMGCGSGPISLAIAQATDRTVKCVAVDSNEQACELTMRNRDSLGLTDRISIVHGTLTDDAEIKLSDSSRTKFSNLNLNTEMFDVIVSNPPYVPTKDISTLAPEIRIYEDLIALDGGEDGLKVIKPLLKYAAKVLKVGGRLLLEVDPAHPEYIQFFTSKYPSLKLRYEHTYKDFCNNDRFVEVSRVP